MASWTVLSPPNLNFSLNLSASLPYARRSHFFKPLNCSPSTTAATGFVVKNDDEVGILCEPCNGKGWLLCDFCKGQKTNVKAVNRRIYRRCPSCRAVGYVLCTKCKVFKCVTFPNSSDGEELSC